MLWEKMASSFRPADELEIVEFLARSPSRVLVLDVLASSEKNRSDVVDLTGLSRATLSRTLSEFEDRGWVTNSGDRYRLTELGAFVAEEFGRLIDRMRVAESLRDVIRWFPKDGYGFDLSLFDSADIVRPSKEDALAPINNLVMRIDAAERVQILSYSLLPDTLQACWRNVRDEQQSVELVLESPVLSAIRSHPPMVSQLRDLASSEEADVFEHMGEVPYVVVIADDVVNLCLSNEDGAPHAMIDTSDREIHSWAKATFEEHRRDAVPVTPGMLSS